ncbi:MAG TPA: phosphotransferase, partial [Ilumatobacteraceae bacterium]|nr:phosphotransferase [Ilumatobacteraceae bacterium]
DALGLGGEPITTLGDEIDRWERAFTTVSGLPDASRAAEVIGALRASVPPGIPARIIHGDFRLGNMLASGAHLNAVVDWEIWGRSDPRLDLA